jgi:hypothetical protein
MNMYELAPQRLGNWIQTVSGRPYWPLDPRPEDVDIADIAHALSNTCRYTGHCADFYSVAEHSVLVSKILPPHLALEGLLHDATEAYLADVSRPVKQLEAFEEYRRIELLNWRAAIAPKFNLPWEMSPATHVADNAVLLAEKEHLMVEPIYPWMEWSVAGEPADVIIHCFPPRVARDLFLKRFVELTSI